MRLSFTPLHVRRPFALLIFMAVFATPTTRALAQPTVENSRVAIDLEAGPLFQTRNEARKPTDIGTTFSLIDLTGHGPFAHFRATATFDLAKRHAIRALAAPVRITGTGAFGAPVLFVDETFVPGTPVDAVYEFNTYRIGYRYLLHQSDNWQVHIGATGLIRDAKIQLTQQGRTAADTDLGFVPLAAFDARRKLTARSWLVFDIEALGASQGRAIDATLRWDVKLGRAWKLGVGYRTIEGGADVESVYSFAWLHFGVLSVGYRF